MSDADATHHRMQYLGSQDPKDDLTHYMESTSRLKAELEESKRIEARWHELYIAAEATMREVAKELRQYESVNWPHIGALADQLDPPEELSP